MPAASPTEGAGETHEDTTITQQTEDGEPTMTQEPQRPVLRNLSEIYRYFRNTAPIYFVSPTAYNVLGIDQWVSGFRYISYFDSFDGAHPHLFSPHTQVRGTLRRSSRSTPIC